MKRLLANTLMLVGGLAASSQLLALGLGELTLKSALNQPLQAEIKLVDTAGLTQWEIKPALASPSDFERAGVDRLFFLTKIKFSVDGDHIVLSSREPVNEPFLNFLVELNWPSGRVLREYTVLLDPPTFQEDNIQPLVRTPAGTAAVATVTGGSNEAGTQSPESPARVSRWESEPAAPGTYKVQPNDTLWEIALQTRPNSGVTAQQMMVAIQSENPHAFIGGNINRLKTHQVLRIPDADKVRDISMARAVAEVDRQNRELTGGAQLDATGRAGQGAASKDQSEGGEVRLLTAKSQDAESAGASGDAGAALGDGRQQALENDLAIALENVDKSRRENDELRQRLEALEEQINTLQRLISLKDDQLATMQTGAATEQQAVADRAAQPAAEDSDSSAQTEPAAAESSAAVLPETAAAEDQVADAESAAATEEKGEVDFNYSQPVDAEKAAVDAEAEAKARRERIAAMLAEQEKAQRPAPGLVDELIANPQLPLAGLGILALLGVLVARLLKKRKAADADDEEEFSEPDLAFTDSGIDTDTLDEFDFDDDDLAHAEGLGDEGHDDLDLGDLEEHEHKESFETVAQTEDVISESDIYIAYGKFEQAVDLLKDAIDKEPSRSDLRLKLLEVYVEMDDAGSFAEAEGELQQLGDRQASAQAEQLRSRLSSPIAPLAAAGAAVAATAQGLTLDDDIPSLDDAAGDEFADGLDFGDALDLSEDLGDEPALLADEGGLEEVPTLDFDDSLDFDLSSDEASESREESDIPVVTEAAADDGLDFDLGETLTDGNGPALAELAEEETAEADDDGDDNALEFDLSSFTDSASEDISDAPQPPVAGAAVDNTVMDFDLSDVEGAAGEEDISSLEDILDGGEGSGELPDLSFDLEDTGFAGSADDDLKALESELDALAGAQAESEEPESFEATEEEVEDLLDFSADIDELDGELSDLGGSVAAEEDEDDVPTLEADELEDLDIPQIDEIADQRIEPVIPENPDFSTEGEIDLDELAAAEDEFDFLAGTDECATKLDLARAYIDMDDFDGARELLQEVMQEGSDQQKTDARSLIDSLS